MKRFIYILISATILFTSCTKEEPLQPNQGVVENAIIEEGILLYGEWKLLDGKMYVDNLETGERIVYDHFDAIKTISSLRYGGAMFEFETIEKNTTTWKFMAPPNWEGYGEFWLDNDSIQPYGLYVIGSNWSVVEEPTATASNMQLGGSSRPLSAVVESYQDNIVVFTVQEAYESINGYNCNYHSELRFQKQ
jgi:hypothetical protein